MRPNVPPAMLRAVDPLHATIEEFAGEGFTHVECYCPRCLAMRLRPISWLPRISMGLTIAQLSGRLRCAECGGQVHSVKPWRVDDVLGKPLLAQEAVNLLAQAVVHQLGRAVAKR